MFVTMTDSFMSEWGRAEGKTNKVIVHCENYEQAETIARNARKRKEMKYVNICKNKPHYNKSRYFVSEKEYSKLGRIWKE